jgi:hypothetical protein
MKNKAVRALPISDKSDGSYTYIVGNGFRPIVKAEVVRARPSR